MKEPGGWDLSRRRGCKMGESEPAARTEWRARLPDCCEKGLVKKVNKSVKAVSLALALVLTAAALGGCGKEDDASSGAEASGTSDASEVNSEYLSYNYSEDLTDEGFWKDVRALDYVTLPNYKGIEIPAEIQQVSDEELQEQIDSMLEDYTTTRQVTDREVEDGDTVNIDYVGSVDGVEFDGGSTGGNGTSVTIGVTNYIDDFLEQLIGHMPGETINVEVTFPEDYGKEELNGKDAVFVTTINYISEDVVPELTDAFVQENLQEYNGWSTAEEARNGMRDNMRKSAENTYLWDTILEGATVSEIPEILMDNKEKSMLKYYATSASQYGVGLDTYLAYFMQISSAEELLESRRDDLEAAAKDSLVRQALFEDMGLSASDEDVDAYFKDVLLVTDYTEYSDYYGMPYIRMMVMTEKMTNAISEQAVRL